ncbi:MAG TPA: XdhC family protein [Desulfobacteraceae bacterium]|nr:XdhC family protein [Desulfobacteraceae bacterium]HPJ68930.1 XdhC family protein [Desulfobacteraceae bacterium]HPQ27904.1 XdhC family protein [Desulfobacteraceae bacterium]
MEEWLKQAIDWAVKGKQVALATVVKVVGTAPRPVGAKMIICSAEQIAGSVSGGCVETAVAQEALDILEDKKPRLLHFGITDEMVWEVGLACGGEIHVLVEPLEPALSRAIEGHIKENRPFYIVTVIKQGHRLGEKSVITADGEVSYSSMTLTPLISQEMIMSIIEKGHAKTISSPNHDLEYFIEPYLPPPLLVIIGGVHIAISLVRYAKELGFKVVVVDPRAIFANRERFPLADEIVEEWPDEALSHMTLNQNTYIAILTHDPKIDEPALTSLLNLSDDDASQKGPRYIGAIGSRKTHSDRFGRMACLGVSAEQLKRVYAPIGLDLGGMTPAEIALSIMAEIVAVKNERSGRSLREGRGNIGT